MAVNCQITAQVLVHEPLYAPSFPLHRRLRNSTDLKAALFCRNNLTAHFSHSYTSRTRTFPPKSVKAALSIDAPSVDSEIDQTSDKNQTEKFNWKSNWFAVQTVAHLDPSRPHNVWVLGRPYVLWKDASGIWRSFLDRCPHRLVPLSEGRIDEQGELQCSYHGWTFKGDGKCSNIPQATPIGQESKAPASVRACATPVPIREAQGLLFIWPDEQGWARADSTPLPLQEAASQPNFRRSGTVRDLAYGWEFLAENVVDVSHLPFAHHGNGPLKRGQGKPLPLQVTTEDALGFTGETIVDVFRSKHTFVTFQAPSSFTYDRRLEIDGKDKSFMITLYVTPTVPGHSRIIVFSASNITRRSFPSWIQHRFDNDVLDGDSFFLHAQERMQRTDGWGAKDWARAYYTPTSSDRFVIAFRQWLTVHGGGGVEWAKGVDATVPATWSSRESVMDRYNGHTKHCKTCSDALNNFEKLQKGAIAASLVLLTIAAAMRSPLYVRAIVGLLAIASAGTAYWLQSQLKYFTYVGYDHASRK